MSAGISITDGASVLWLILQVLQYTYSIVCTVCTVPKDSYKDRKAEVIIFCRNEMKKFCHK